MEIERKLSSFTCVPMRSMDLDTRLHEAARVGQLDLLASASRIETNHRDSIGLTPTLWAAFAGQLDALRLLVALGGKVEVCDVYGNSALHLASANGHASLVCFLLECDSCNVFALDIDGHTAFRLAAINGHGHVLHILREAIDNLDAKTADRLRSRAEKERRRVRSRFEKLFDKTFSNVDNPMGKWSLATARRNGDPNREVAIVPSSENVTLLATHHLHEISMDTKMKKAEKESETTKDEVATFLECLNLSEYWLSFRRERIDLEALLLLNETDLAAMGIEIGPRKKMAAAILRRRQIRAQATLRQSAL